MPRRLLFLLCLVLAAARVLTPPTAAAQDSPSIVSYGMEGFGTGAATGLAVGYLSTGRTFDSGEWRNLLFGAGVGALTGLGVGIVLGIADAGSEPYRPGMGYYILRDMDYGVGLGALAGATVGALVWLDDGRPKDVLIGMAWGAVIGTGAGLVLGTIEGALRLSAAPPPRRGVSLGFGFTPGPGGAPLPSPVLSGRF